MHKIAATLLTILALSACGGGDDDQDSGEQVLVRATTTHSEPDSNAMRSQVTFEAESPPSPTGLTGPYRIRTCVTGTWRQTLRVPATWRLEVKIYGRTVRTVENIAGVAGAENRAAFPSGCWEVSGIGSADFPVFTRGSATIIITAMDNRESAPINGYDATIEWTVTRIE